MDTLRLMVADGNEIVRKGLCAFFREQPGWEVAGEARDGREAVMVAKKTMPDVAIMDICMPLLNGLDATRQIAKSGQTKVLLLSLYETELVSAQAAEAGALGYLAKSDSAGMLISAVKALRSGRMFFSAKTSEEATRLQLSKILKVGGRGQSRQITCLTYREREVLQLVAEGNSSKEVAIRLGITTKTAETHRANVMKKIDCHTVSALVRYAIRNHMIAA